VLLIPRRPAHLSDYTEIIESSSREGIPSSKPRSSLLFAPKMHGLNAATIAFWTRAWPLTIVFLSDRLHSSC